MKGRYGKSKIYYGDGTTRDGDDEDAPKIGIIAIVQNVGGARTVTHGMDFYWKLDHEWVGGDRHGADMYLMQPGWKKIYYGTMVNTHIFNALMTMVSEDPEFPVVSNK